MTWLCVVLGAYSLHRAHSLMRNNSRRQLTEQMTRDGISEDKKARMLASHGKKESDFLRLRRVRLGVSDFQTLKVIGKGAFGEVRPISIVSAFILNRRPRGTLM